MDKQMNIIQDSYIHRLIKRLVDRLIEKQNKKKQVCNYIEILLVMDMCRLRCFFGRNFEYYLGVCRQLSGLTPRNELVCSGQVDTQIDRKTRRQMRFNNFSEIINNNKNGFWTCMQKQIKNYRMSI